MTGTPARLPGRPRRTGGWRAVTATERGAAHRAAGIPNQDAVGTIPLDNGGIVAAVADGHGHSRHFRSARGAQLAVSIACQAARDLTTRAGGRSGSLRSAWPGTGVPFPGRQTAGTARGGAAAGDGGGER